MTELLADPNVANRDSETPLHVASRNGPTATAALIVHYKLLRDHGGRCYPVPEHERPKGWMPRGRRLLAAEIAADSSEDEWDVPTKEAKEDTQQSKRRRTPKWMQPSVN